MKYDIDKRVHNLHELDRVINGYSNDKTANTKVRLYGFEDWYCEIGIIMDKGYVVNKKIAVEDLVRSIENHQAYVVNPSALNKYFKQKWYMHYCHLD